MCVEEGCYSKRAIDCKPKQIITTWFLTCNFNISLKALFRIERFLCLGWQFIIWVSNRDKRIDELKSHRKENTAKIFFGWIRFTFRLIQSSGIKTAQRLPAAPSAPPGIIFFFALERKFPGVGTLELSNPPGGDKKRGQMPVLRRHCNIFHWSHSQIVPFWTF